MKLFQTIKDLFYPHEHDLAIIAKLRPCQYMNPTKSMLVCEESARMKTASGSFFLMLYYTGCKTYIRFPRALPTELKGVAV